jgi:hypothetical protein
MSASFTVWMLLGVFITKTWVSNPVNICGRSRTLEDLGQGRAVRQKLERNDRDALQAYIGQEAECIGGRRRLDSTVTEIARRLLSNSKCSVIAGILQRSLFNIVAVLDIVVTVLRNPRCSLANFATREAP